MGPKIPPRWLDCPRKSRFIAQKFIAFKTFLDERYNDQISEEKRFGFLMLQQFLVSGEVPLRLIIDLTKTDRFYNKSVIEKAGVAHVKIPCEGHAGAPSKDQVSKFIETCSNFFRDNPDGYIGVHCTHGFNRTGFMICSYLIEREDYDTQIAVEIFSQGRPPGIYKQDYLNELFARYESMNTAAAPLVPELPDWCREEADDGNSDNDLPDSSLGRKAVGTPGMLSEPPSKRRKREPVSPNAKFASGVSGVQLVLGQEATSIQERCESLCGYNLCGFPGSQPVTMDVNNMRFVVDRPYRVSWKADGVRYLMYILKAGKVFMLDRDNNVFTMKLTFPSASDPNEHLTDTLIDGELVFDKQGDTVHPRYLIYDLIALRGVDMKEASFDQRLARVEKEVVDPRNIAASMGQLNKTSEPFGIRKKDFFPVSRTDWLYTKFVPKLTHLVDGLIFQPVHLPYKAGRCNDILKWKSSELNSVDFLLKISTVKGEGCLNEKVGFLHVSNYAGYVDMIKVTKEMVPLAGKIVECTWTPVGWKMLRVREDKSFPNSLETARSVCDSIKNPVTLEVLVAMIRGHGDSLVQ